MCLIYSVRWGRGLSRNGPTLIELEYTAVPLGCPMSWYLLQGCTDPICSLSSVFASTVAVQPIYLILTEHCDLLHGTSCTQRVSKGPSHKFDLLSWIGGRSLYQVVECHCY